MRRRQFITLLGGAAAKWPLRAHAQQAGKVPRIGMLYPGPKAAAPSRVEALLSGLRATGYSAPAQVELILRSPMVIPRALLRWCRKSSLPTSMSWLVWRCCERFSRPLRLFQLLNSTWKLTQWLPALSQASRIRVETLPASSWLFRILPPNGYSC
jgi:hypothetical protein